VFPQPRLRRWSPEVRLVDVSHRRVGRMVIVVTCAHVDIPDFLVAPGDASYDPADREWVVAVRDGAGLLHTDRYPSKATARAVLRRAGRAHAKGLKIRFCEQQGRHDHPEDETP